MACCENLAAILDACAGGRGTSKDIIKAYIACTDDVSAIPLATNHVVSTDITMVTDKTFFQIDIDKVGSSYQAEPQGEGQSKEYLTTAVIFIAGLGASVTNSLNALIRGSAMLIIEDNNGNKRIIGKVGNGADVAVREQNDRNGYVVTATWASPDLPLFYTGTVPLT